MGKFENKNRKSKKRDNRTLLVVVLALIAIALAIFVVPNLLYLMKDNDPTDESKLAVPTVQVQQTEDPTYSNDSAYSEDPTYSNEVENPVDTEPVVETEETNPVADTEPAETEKMNPVVDTEPAETEKMNPVVDTEPAETEKMNPVVDTEPAETEKMNPVADTEPSETKETNPVADTEPAETEEINISEAVSFPLVLADGRLEIENTFQFDGLNPDNGNQEGFNIAAITVNNLSDEYLAKADISMKTDSGVTLHFVISDLPSGKSTIAFATDNATTNADTQYGDISCDAGFDPDASMNEEKISVSVDGIQVVLQNNTGKQIGEVVVYCHSTMGDQYFGGITYTYTVNNLPANGTAEVMAVDCILGLAEVVRVVINEP